MKLSVKEQEDMLGKYRVLVKRFAQRFSRDPDEVEDITQECLLKIWNSLHTFKGESLASTWLYSIVRNTAINIKTRKKVETLATESEDYGEDSNIAAADPAAQLIALEQEEKFLKLKEKINPLWIELFDMVSEGISYKEISELKGIPVGTVKSSVARAKAQLQKRLS